MSPGLPIPPGAPRSPAGRSLRRFCFYSILIVLALAPLPLGSNRPFFWAVNGVVIAVLAIAYLFAIGADPTRLAIPLRAFYLPGVLFAIVIVWMLIQVLPLPTALVPSTFWVDAGQALGEDLSSHISIDPAATIAMIVRQLTYGFLFLLVVQLTADRDRARLLLDAIFWIIVAHGALAIVTLFEFGDRLLLVLPKWAYEGFATGSFVNRNAFATLMAFGLAVGAVLSLDRYLPAAEPPDPGASAPPPPGRNTSLAVRAAGIAILVTALLLSASRMGAFSAAAGVLIAFVLAYARLPRGRVRLAVPVIGALALLAMAFVVSGSVLSDRIGSVEAGADERLTLYGQVLGMIAARPLTGFGGGTFVEAFPLFHHLPLSTDLTWDAAHDVYLEVFSDLGIFALALLASVIVLFFRLFPPLRKRDWLAPASAIGVTAAGAIHSIVDFTLQYEANVFILLAVLGAGTSQAWRSRVRDVADASALAVHENLKELANATLTSSRKPS